MNQITQRLEALFAERSALIDRYAELWAVHGGGSDTWEKTLLAIETHEIREGVRTRLAKTGEVKANQLKDALQGELTYRAAVHAKIQGRTEWAKVREQWTTLTWRIQLEMAKLRLELGDEATPATLALAADEAGLTTASTEQEED